MKKLQNTTWFNNGLNTKTTVKKVADFNIKKSLVFAVACALANPAWSQTVTQQIAALQKAVAALQSANTALQAKVNNNSVLALNGKLSFDSKTNTALFTGVNVQIQNGLGTTSTYNKYGNLIIGYNEAINTAPLICSNGHYTDQASCTKAGEIWANNQQMGSHNLVLGQGQSFTRYGAIVAGLNNVSNAEDASVIGGLSNTASATLSVVTGGSYNNASGFVSSVTGGSYNRVSGMGSTVSGGGGLDSDKAVGNVASGNWSSISGGIQNIASGTQGSVSGGDLNTAYGSSSSVSGGALNTAYGSGSSISGGNSNQAKGNVSSVSGGIGNIAAGNFSSVSGGGNRQASDEVDWVAGGLFQDF